MEAPQGGSKESEGVAPACGEVESVEPDMEDEVTRVEARDEFFDKVVDVQDKSGYESCLVDIAAVGEIEQSGRCNQVISMPDTEGGTFCRLSEDVQIDHTASLSARSELSLVKRVATGSDVICPCKSCVDMKCLKITWSVIPINLT